MNTSQLIIDDLRPDDWQAVRAIYADGIATGIATLETVTPEWDVWDAKFLPRPRLAARLHGELLGWATLSRVSPRPAYSGVAEVTIYIAAHGRGQSIGSRLLPALVSQSEAAGYWTLRAAIFPANIASIRLHERCGFRVLGVQERVGHRDGQWYDITLMERRSAVTGTPSGLG